MNAALAATVVINTMRTYPPPDLAHTDIDAFITAVVAYDRAEADDRERLLYPRQTGDRYIDPDYFLRVLDAPLEALDALFEHPHTRSYMRRMARDIIYHWLMTPPPRRLRYDLFLLVYKHAPFFNDTLHVIQRLHYLFHTVIIDGPAHIRGFEFRGGLTLTERDLNDAFRPPTSDAFMEWAWARCRRPYDMPALSLAVHDYTRTPQARIWEMLSHEADFVRYMHTVPRAEPAAAAMRGHRRRRAAARLHKAFRAVWGAVAMWRLYQTWRLHPAHLSREMSALSLTTANSRAAFRSENHDEEPDSDFPTAFSLTAVDRYFRGV